MFVEKNQIRLVFMLCPMSRLDTLIEPLEQRIFLHDEFRSNTGSLKNEGLIEFFFQSAHAASIQNASPSKFDEKAHKEISVINQVTITNHDKAKPPFKAKAPQPQKRHKTPNMENRTQVVIGDRAQRIAELEELTRQNKIAQAAGFVDQLTFGATTKMSDSIVNRDSLFYKQGKMVGSVVGGLGAATARTGIQQAVKMGYDASNVLFQFKAQPSRPAPSNPVRKQYGAGFPDRDLPRDGRKMLIDREAVGRAHTQLGRRGKGANRYPQAREFDANGKAVRDIDFTDHGFPDKHMSPHQHKWLPNGSRCKEAKPLNIDLNFPSKGKP